MQIVLESRRRLKDAIANVTLGQGPRVFPGVGFVPAGGTYRQRENVDAVKVRGIEASAAWSRRPWLVQAGVSWTHARMEASGAAAFLDGLRPAQTPNFAATLAFGCVRVVAADAPDSADRTRRKPVRPAGHGGRQRRRLDRTRDAAHVVDRAAAELSAR